MNKLINWFKENLLIAPKESPPPKKPIGESSDSFETMIARIIIAGHQHRVANGLPLNEFDKSFKEYLERKSNG